MRYWIFALGMIWLMGCNESDTAGPENPFSLPSPGILYFTQGKLNQEKVKALLESGIDVNAMDENGQALLHIAVWNGDLNGVKFLHSQGAYVDIMIMSHQVTPLRVAAEAGHRDIAEFLIASGADVNVEDIGGYTPLHRAAIWGHKDMVELLLQHGAEIECLESKRCTPLYFAAARGHREVVELLFAHNARANIVDQSGYTPLHEAAYHNYVEIGRLLIERGVDVNAKNIEGVTALHMATKGDNSGENVEIAQLLLEHQADVNVQDNQGRTPLDWANFYVHDRVGEVLRRYGGKTRFEIQEAKAVDENREPGNMNEK